jgi:nitroimidazol reductase NimA-like FMN-containing flavoprotein (pyridoxamine 5'-phosphate oxidase superfamily)
MDAENPIGELTSDECWDLLRSHSFGRLAFHLGPEVHVTPINYAVEDRLLLFRTAPGNKLVGVAMNPDVVFEIDEYDGATARSVIVRGTARRLDEDQQVRADALPLHPWVPTAKYEVVEIRPEEVTGRAFYLDPAVPHDA